jgi:hypothetical protein
LTGCIKASPAGILQDNGPEPAEPAAYSETVIEEGRPEI